MAIEPYILWRPIPEAKPLESPEVDSNQDVEHKQREPTQTNREIGTIRIPQLGAIWGLLNN